MTPEEIKQIEALIEAGEEYGVKKVASCWLFADNGEASHAIIVNAENGETVSESICGRAALFFEQAANARSDVKKMFEKYKVLHSIVCEQDTEDLENAFLVNWLSGDIKIPSIVKDRLFYEDDRYKKMYEENKRLLEENAELDRHIQELEYNATR